MKRRHTMTEQQKLTIQQKPHKQKPRKKAFPDGCDNYAVGRDFCNTMLRDGNFDSEERQKILSLRDWFLEKQIARMKQQDSKFN
jgi:hypothetical protein